MLRLPIAGGVKLKVGLKKSTTVEMELTEVDGEKFLTAGKSYNSKGDDGTVYLKLSEKGVVQRRSRFYFLRMLGEVGGLGCMFYALGAMVFPCLSKLLYTREL